MTNSPHALRSLAAGTCLAVMAAGTAASPALAGPCSDQIAELGRALSQSPALGPATTGTLTGAAPGSTPQPGTAPAAGGGAAPSAAGTSADNRVGGTAGTKEVNASVGNLVATSPQDVRRQQEGLPTAAAASDAARNQTETSRPASAQQPDDRTSQAKMELERARMLDQRDDRSCTDAITRTRQLMGRS